MNFYTLPLNNCSTVKLVVNISPGVHLETHSSLYNGSGELNVLNLESGTDVQGHALDLTPVSLPQEAMMHCEFILNVFSDGLS